MTWLNAIASWRNGRMQIADAQKQIADAEKQIADAEKQIADLEHQLALRQQNSTTTSKPPTSDGLAGRPRERSRRTKSRRKRGGQPTAYASDHRQFCWAHFTRNLLSGVYALPRARQDFAP